MELVFDIESNGLYREVQHVYCITIKPVSGASHSHSETYTSKPMRGSIGNIEEGLERLSEASKLIGHNIIGYDFPVLKKLYDWTPKETCKIFDTMVVSRLLNPDRVQPPSYTGKGGPHSLECWGYRIGVAKPEHEDWSSLSPAMLRRNQEDVEINVELYRRLGAEMAGHNWSESIEIEQDVLRIITQQEISGVQFDLGSARRLIDRLNTRIDDIDSYLHENIPRQVKQKGTASVTKPFKINGKPTAQAARWLEEQTQYLAGPFSKIEFKTINIGSMPQVKKYLLDSGWEPTEWNYKDGVRTSPKLTEDSFGTISGEVGKFIKERYLCGHRKSQIQGWIDRVRDDGCLSAGANTCGTNTGRFRHINVVNVPKAADHVFLGPEMRALFTASEGRKLVGHDASGLELRMLAHYMNDSEYIDAILHGDIHSTNQSAAGLPNRDAAKTFIYAFLYGAGNEKIGSIVGGDDSDGAELKRKFLSATPSLKRLITNVRKASKKGWLRGLDNRKLHMRRMPDGRVMEHKALNTLLQGGGAIVMKKSMVILDDLVQKENLDAIKVLDMHDEAQADVHPSCVKRYCELAEQSIVKAGEHFNLNIPLAAEAKIGNNWAETH